MFTYMEDKATARLEQKIEAGEFSEDQLIEIKIPIKVPYYSSTKYENYYGETKFNGEHYRYVKRKINGDTLYLLCLPHTEKDNIVAAKKDFINSVNDIQNNNTPEKQGHPSLVKILMSKYVQQDKISASDIQITFLTKLHSPDSYLNSQFIPQTLGQPPESI